MPCKSHAWLMTTQLCKRRQWHPTPVLLPGKSHGRRSLVGCSPWGRWGLDTTEWLHFHFSLSCIGEGNGNPLQCSCLENPRDSRAWWAAICGVAQSLTRLRRLSSSSSSDSLEIRGTGVVVGWSYSRKDFKHAKWPVKGYTLNHYHHHHPFVKSRVKHFFSSWKWGSSFPPLGWS